MRYDGADVSSLGAIAFGSLVGLLGTGLVMERLDDGRDARVEQRIEQRIEVGALSTDPTTAKLLRTYPPIRLRPRVRTTVDLRNGPVIFIDGVRMEATMRPDDALEDLAASDIESIEVRKNPDDPTPGEIRIRLKH